MPSGILTSGRHSDFNSITYLTEDFNKLQATYPTTSFMHAIQKEQNWYWESEWYIIFCLGQNGTMVHTYINIMHTLWNCVVCMKEKEMGKNCVIGKLFHVFHNSGFSL